MHNVNKFLMPEWLIIFIWTVWTGKFAILWQGNRNWWSQSLMKMTTLQCQPKCFFNMWTWVPKNCFKDLSFNSEQLRNWGTTIVVRIFFTPVYGLAIWHPPYGPEYLEITLKVLALIVNSRYYHYWLKIFCLSLQMMSKLTAKQLRMDKW